MAIIESEHGITQRSLETFKRNKRILKGEVMVIMRHDPDASDWYRTTITDGNEIIELSGLSIGYTGEGSRGLATVLDELGLPHTDRDIGGSIRHGIGCKKSVHIFTKDGAQHHCLRKEGDEYDLVAHSSPRNLLEENLYQYAERLEKERS